MLLTDAADDGFAVIGISCRLPGAPDPAGFWRLLADGRSAITEPPVGREHTPGRRGGFLDAVERFDADFFDISPREAVAMDPQQRLALELGWEAIEDAGIVPATLRGERAGVFAGVMGADYAILRAQRPSGVDHYALAGTQRGLVANRISYLLGLHGPSLTVDTAQSSSLVAVHLAAQSLRSGESTVALAGGVHLNLAAETALAADRLGALSPDGICYVFDARANGYVRGEGGAFVLLKTLRRALADGDPVYCVIRGSAVNNDGGGGSLTTPDAAAQADVLRQAYARTGVDPASVHYVELHGTGTAVGDPVEAAALGAVFAARRSGSDALRVGSAKTNVGHLEGAAGIVGLVKTALALRYRQLPPSLNFAAPNPRIDFERLRLQVQRDLSAWNGPPIAGVSSFGMGGTNCHVVVAGSPPEAQTAARWEPVSARPGPEPMLPLVLSGRSAPALRAQAGRLRDMLTAGAAPDTADVGFSLATTRTVFGHRAVVLGRAREDLLRELEVLHRGEASPRVVEGRGAGIPVFVFPGQGGQWKGMAAGLLRTSNVFRDEIEACDAALSPHVDWSLTGVLRGEPGSPPLERVDVVQPVLFAVMVSLAALWRSYGVEPAAVVGHSQGEIAAAYVSGALDLADAARVVALRSQVVARLAGDGLMAFVPLPAAEIEQELSGYGGAVTVAAVNGPASTTVSGAPAAVRRLLAGYEARGVRVREIPVDYASHGPRVEPLRAALVDALTGIAPRPSLVPFYSTVTGELLDTAGLDAEYWYQNLRRPVRFETVVRGLAESGDMAFIEISPHPVLAVGMEQTLESAGRNGTVLGSLRRDEGGLDRFLTSAAQAFVRGVPVDWSVAFAGWGAAKLRLPTYAFQRRRHWPEDPAPPPGPAPAQGSGRPAGPAAAERAGTADSTPGGQPVDSSMDGPQRTVLAARLAALPEAARERMLLDLVGSQVAAVLGHHGATAVDPDRTFRELGMDSVTALECRDRVNAATGLRLPTTAAYDHPTPRALAARLAAELLGTATDAETPRGASASTDEPIAIVAMACRFPGGVTSPEQLWHLLRDEQDATSAFPVGRGWDIDGDGVESVRRGGFLHDADKFDADFFGISPREATAMDPQQRLLLETAWEAVERAGIAPDSLRGGGTGVFVGVMPQEYGPRLGHSGDELGGYLLTGNTTSVASGRIAYTLGLAGPAVTVDTACSSSLVALHLASQSLRQGECELALAGGATVMATPGMFMEFGLQGGLSPDGRCKPFASAADGTAWAEGVGMLMLERLPDALRNNHPVLALIRGSAVNSDGASNGLTAPNGPSQERVIRRALAEAGLGPHDVDAVEAHGTGTALGDPIEAQALLATYGRNRPADRPLWLGSLKSNLGHTQAAAGVAGVIKMVAAMRHGVLPRSLHVDEPSRHVDWGSGGVRLLTQALAWPRADRPRRAGVSAFGISGTNAHLILEQAPPEAPEGSAGHAETAIGGESGGGESGGVTPWPLSARSEPALRAQARQLKDLLVARPALAPADVAHALVTSRASLSHRAVLLGTRRDDFLRTLEHLIGDEESAGLVRGVARHPGRTALVFPGQGSQWTGMAAELEATQPVFRRALVECAEALAPYTGWSVLDVLREPLPERVDVVQPALFAVMVSLAALWRSYGVEPDAVVGHSQGEIAAGYVAGALSLRDAAATVALRARALAGIAGTGGMAAVAAPAAEVRRRLARWDGRLVVATVNGPASATVAGDPSAVEQLLADCARDGVPARRVAVDYASHSPHVESLRDEIRDALAGITPRTGEVAFYSAVTGRQLDTRELDAGYWFRNLRQTVDFDAAVRTMLDDGYTLFIECSPHPVLTGSVEDIAAAAGRPATAVGSLRRDDGGTPRFLASVAQTYTSGVAVSWPRQRDGRVAERVELPTYPFQRRRYWAAPAGPAAAGTRALGQDEAAHPLLGASLGLAADGTRVHTGRLSVGTHPWLAEHVVAGTVLLPGAALVELARYAGEESGSEVAELTLESPLTLPAHGAAQVQLTVGAPDDAGRRPVTVHSRPEAGGDWIRHASGALTTGSGAAQGDPEAWPPRGAVAIDVPDLYARLTARGYEYGPAFRGVRAAWRRGEELFAEVSLAPEWHPEAARYGIHPALLDAALHLAIPGADRPYLPFSWAGVRLYASGATELRVRIAPIGGDGVTLSMSDPAGAPVATIDAMTMRPLPDHSTMDRGRGDADVYQVRWVEPAALPSPDGTASAAIRWATIGDAPQSGESYPDLAALHRSAASGTTPDAVALPVGSAARRTGDAPDVAAEVHALVHRVLATVREFLAGPAGGPARLVVVTRGAVSTVDDGEITDLPAAAAWGLLRTAQAENPGRLVLVDTDDAPASRQALAHVLALDEPQLAIRAGRISVPRLVRAAPEGYLTPPPGEHWRLEIQRPGTLDNLRLAGCPEQAGEPAPGQVRVAVHTAGLNFRDVLVALGIVVRPGEPLGLEGAGTVLAVGPGVTGLVPGDRVMGVLPGAFGPVATVDHRMLVPVPAGWSFTQAAAAPIVFLTAYYGLVDVAGVRAGDSVLIHAAAGGVGMAAVQLARHLGAEVYATASPAKQDTVAALGVPRERIASSRSTGFEPVLREASAGRGVDVVLNSLAGDFVDASLRLLAEGGRFVEIGKTDVRDPGDVARARHDVAYRVFDLIDDAGPARIGEMLAELVGLFERGSLRPLPVSALDIHRAPDAFRLLREGAHTGKVVLTVRPGPATVGATLLSGGTGTLGAVVARHLVTAWGVRDLVLASRTGNGAAGAGDLVAELTALGARVSLAACDLTDRQAAARLLDGIRRERPLGMVVHAAGVLGDGVLESLTPEEVDRVLRPKVDAAWHLHELTRHAGPVDFVFFSSAAGTLGTPGQANYAAANAFLDALAHHRRAAGLPARSLAWGLWERRSAMTGQLTEADRARLARSGLAPMLTGDGTALLDRAWRFDRAVLVPARLAEAALRGGPAPVPALLRELATEPVAASGAEGPSGAEASPAPRRRPGPAGNGAAGNEAVLGRAAGELARRVVAAPPDQRDQILLSAVREHATAVLGRPGGEPVAADRAFRDAGFDSLTSVELRNRLNAATGLSLPATVAFEYPTPRGLAAHLAAELPGGAGGTGAAAAAPTAATAAGDEAGNADDPVVVVGMACRYPGSVGSPDQLWELLVAGRDAVTTFPPDRGWDLAGLAHRDPDRVGTTYATEGGFLTDAAGFDAEFFGVSPREATAMDPQQRHLLEVCWEAVERTGIDPSSLRGTGTGVFIGSSGEDYTAVMAGAPQAVAGYSVTGIASSVLSGRVAYALGLEGPALTVDTACSSSLVAVHLAARALRGGECDLALAGGVTVMATAGAFVEFSRQRGLARDGRCRSFAAAADGTGFAEGVGVVVLERLSAARRRGHQVLGVIRGSAVNQDGASNGLTAPSGPAQERVIRRALEDAGLPAECVDVVEGHGTGTRLGDPIEARALVATYGRDRPADRPLLLGSLKSNIGHTQAAAGVAGLIKMLLAMRHETVPASIHVDRPSPLVAWDGVRLVTQPLPWPRTGQPKRAGISSFGISGTNAHLILESPPAQSETAAAPRPARRTLALALSARSAPALREQAGRLYRLLDDGPGIEVADAAHAMLTTRGDFEHRAVALGRDRAGVLAGLRALSAGTAAPGLIQGTAGEPGRTALVFPGQGSQWVGMAAGLVESSVVFRESLVECGRVLGSLVDWSLVDVVCGGDGGWLDRVDVVQPVLFGVMVSLARVWRSVGVGVDAVVGHSQGEIAAACVAGGLSLEDAARVVVLRSRVLGGLAGSGVMAAVGLPEAEVLRLIGDGFVGVSVAAVNGPAATVVSGEASLVLGLVERCRLLGVRVRVLPVDYASHSVGVEVVRERLLAELGSVCPRSGEVLFYSTVTGGPLDMGGLDAGYWYRNLREPVRFADTIRRLVADGFGTFIEASPHPVLTGAIHDTVDAATAVGTLRRGQGGWDTFLASVAEAHCRGVAVDWTPALGPGPHRRVDLPTYPFQHERYWLPVPGPAGPTDEAGTRFWDAVESGDIENLARELELDEAGRSLVAGALPALVNWRRRSRQGRAARQWHYAIAWRHLPDPVITEESPSSWLVLAPAEHADDGWVRGCLAALKANGIDVVEVPIDAGMERADLAAALRAVPADGVLSLLAVAPGSDPRYPSVPRGFASTLTAVQALGDAGIEAPLWSLTQGAVSTGPDDPVTRPVQALVWGLGRVVAVEHPRRWGGLVDLPDAFDEATGRHLAAALNGIAAAGSEGTADAATEDQVAIRRAGVYARRIVSDPVPDAAPARAWRPTGTVLITGGTGALGGHVARWLARAGAGHLLLAGRRGIDAPGAAQLRDELVALGAQVTVAACDVADRAALAHLLDGVPEQAPLTAVVHTAAVLDDSAIDALTLHQAEAALRPKLDAAWNLHELTRELDLSAFVLFSSVSSTFGVTGQANYAPANAYLESLAHYRRAHGLPATAVAWGAWSGGGLADGPVSQTLHRHGLPQMDPKRAVEALQRCLDENTPAPVIADIDWSRFLLAFTATRPSPLVEEVPEVRRIRAAERGAPPAGPTLVERLADQSPARRVRTLSDLVRGHVAAVLGHAGPDAVTEDRALSDLGFDSVTGLELRNRLGNATGLRLPTTLVFDHPTVRALSGYLLETLFPEPAWDDPGSTEEAPARDGAHRVGEGDASIDELDVEDLVRLARANRERERDDGENGDG